MMMQFAWINLEWSRPGLLWLTLVLVLVSAAYRFSLSDLPVWQRRLSLALRCLLLLLLVSAAAGLTLVKGGSRRHTVFLIDQSDSIDTNEIARVRTWVEESLAQARPGDRQTVLAFAEDSLPPQAARGWTNDVPAGARGATRMTRALQAAITSIDPAFEPHLVLCTDGWFTGEDPTAVLDALSRSGASLDLLPVGGRSDPEVQVVEVSAPDRVHVGEPFRIRVAVDANVETSARIGLYRAGLLLAEEKTVLQPGTRSVRFRHVPVEGQRQVFSVRVEADRDTLADNNQGVAAVTVAGRPRVLSIGARTRTLRPFKQALEQEDLDAELRAADGFPRELSDLQQYDVLCMHNLPADAMTGAQMEMVRRYVRDLGGGLILLGGDASYGLGGYYRTALEDLIPLRGDFKRERESPSLGMVLVLDKSGSMRGMKIELAKEAARASVNVLDPRDQIGVLAFDGQPRWISTMHSAADKATLYDRIATLQSGGGTDLGAAMRETLRILNAVPTRLKHAILLSDGISSPDDFLSLTQSLVAAGITVSTVGIGEGADRALLESIAAWGGGRCYVSTDPSAVPQIFARETLTAARTALFEEPFTTVPLQTGGWLEGLDFNDAPFLLGCVRTRPKATAEVVLATEFGDPLLASWRYGLGRVAAFTSDAESRWAAEWLDWEGYGPFWAQVVRAVKRPASGDGLAIHWQREGDALVVEASTDWLALDPNESVMLHTLTPALEKHDLLLERQSPGRFRGRIALDDPGLYHLRFSHHRAGRSVSETERTYAAGYPPEYRLRPPAVERLQNWARLGNGRYDPSSDQLFATRPFSPRVPVPMWPALLVAALLVFLAELLLRRLDFKSIKRSRSRVLPDRGGGGA